MFDFIWQLMVVLMLVAASAFFVAAEFALVRIRASQLRPMLKSGDRRVRVTLKIIGNLDAALSATQIGITLANLAIGWIAEPFVRGWIEPLFHAIGITNTAVIHIVSILAAFVAVPFVLIVFGELVPKLVAIQRARSVSLWVAIPLDLIQAIFKPFIWFLNTTSNRVIHLAGLDVSGGSEHNLSADELDDVLTHSRHTHSTDILINKIMIRSLRLRETRAAQVMLPRDQMTCLWLDHPLEENIRIAQSSGHSRFPVCDGTIDNIVGMVLVKEWLWQIQVLGGDQPFKPILRPVLTFTTRTPLPALLEFFRSSRSHLAVIIDEQGCIAGMLTIEDVLEEIVGEIRDELDIEKGPIYDMTDNSILVDATLPVRDLRAETGWNIELQGKETVATWLARHAGGTPKKGATYRIGEFYATAAEAGIQGPRRVRVTRMSQNEIEAIEGGE